MDENVPRAPVASDRQARKAPTRPRRRRDGRSPGDGYLFTPDGLLFSRLFTPEQFRAVLIMMRFANYERGEVPVDGRGYSVTLDAGEALISVRDFARDHLGMDRGEAGRSFTRRLLAKAEKAGIAALRPATDPRPSPHADPRGDPPPTIVRFLKWRARTWPRSVETDPPPDPGSVSDSTPSNLGTKNPKPEMETETAVTEPSVSPHGAIDGPRHSRSALARLPPEILQVKSEIEERTGRGFVVPTQEADRSEMIRQFEFWLATCRREDVIEACVREAERNPEVFSLAYFARAANRLVNALDE